MPLPLSNSVLDPAGIVLELRRPLSSLDYMEEPDSFPLVPPKSIEHRVGTLILM